MLEVIGSLLLASRTSCVSAFCRPIRLHSSSAPCSMREVVITGLGIVSPIGVGRERCGSRSRRGAAACGRCRNLASAGWIAPFGGEVVDFDPKELIQPRKSIKVMSREIQLASAAAELAWQDAGLAEATIDPERFGVIGAAGMLVLRAGRAAACRSSRG